MKKISILLLFICIFVCSSCSVVKSSEYSIILPTGAPSIALSSFLYQKDDKTTVTIVSGSDPLVAAFSSSNYDVIVAPVNLGAKFYNQLEDPEYLLYRPIVGCNYYILTSIEGLTFNDLDNMEIIAFNENSTPGVMLKALSKYYDINPNITYLSSVNEVNPYLISKRVEVILTAEPSKTIVCTKGDFDEIDILALWQEMAHSEYNVPQAGIFVKKELLKNKSYLDLLDEMTSSIEEEPMVMAERAILVDPNLASMDKDLLAMAIPNCHFIKNALNQKEVEYYFSKIMEFGLGQTIGGKLPDDEFYYQKN